MIKTADRRAFAAMSALGQKQTCAVQKGMSALPPKADINRHICACISPTDFMSTRPSQNQLHLLRVALLHSRVMQRRGPRVVLPLTPAAACLTWLRRDLSVTRRGTHEIPSHQTHRLHRWTQTGVSLEDAFWSCLNEIAQAQGVTVSQTVTEIEKSRQGGNLSSAIRLFVLDWARSEKSGGHRRGTRQPR
jgi:predicted DNA-binding ribbon-helix-helix protein